MLDETTLLLVVVGFMIAFLLAFGIGANDVANSFGTSVGSKVLSLQAACILATICEVSGSILLGGSVSATIRGGIVDPTLFNETKNGDFQLMLGQVSSLAGSCLWMLVATFFKIPVSGTHSIVGATAGFGLVLFGSNGVQWMGVLKIVISWFVSPLLSGFISTCMFLIIKYSVLRKEESLEPALYSLPFLYGVTVIVNVFSVLYGGLKIFNVPDIPLWITLVVSFSAGIITGLFVFFVVRPIIRKKVLKRMESIANGTWEEEKKNKKKLFYRVRDRIVYVFQKRGNSANTMTPNPSEGSATDAGPSGDSKVGMELNGRPLSNGSSNLANIEEASIGFPDQNNIAITVQACDRPEEAQVFSFAQILTATFGSFVHGGNDVSNAIGPLIGLWLVATTGNVLMSASSPVWILLYGGVGISVGLWVWGRKVMETVGTDLTVITPSSGMCIELGAAVTVLIASKVGLPVSTTHCLVGSVIFVGHFRSKANVNWRLFMGIIVAWIVTLPISGALSALIMYIFTKTIPLPTQ